MAEISLNNLQTQVNGKAASSHTHTKENISDFPTSLPANGGTSTYTEFINNGAKPMRFNWVGKSGQPTWLWGGELADNMYVYNPANFNVNYANSAGNADTVDGKHFSDIEALISSGFDLGHSFSQNGYQKFSNGLILQWGITGVINADDAATIAFPIAFPNNCLSVCVTGTGGSSNYGANIVSMSGPSFYILNHGSYSSCARAFLWQAIGY